MTSPCIFPYSLFSFEKEPWDFPGGLVVKSPSSNAGDSGSIPGWGIKISHAVGQLSLHATTMQPVRSGAHAATKTQCNQNFKNNIKSTYKKKKECCLPAMSSGCYPCLLRLKRTFLILPFPGLFTFPLSSCHQFLSLHRHLKSCPYLCDFSFLLLLSPL